MNDIWEQENSRRGGKLHNGRVFSITSYDPTHIIGQFDDYRYLVAQTIETDLYDVLNIRVLAVSGMILCADGIVFGKRSQNVFQDRGKWELMPSGGIDAGQMQDDSIDFRRDILREFEEETGLPKEHVTAMDVLCLLEDNESHVFDIGVKLETAVRAGEITSSWKTHNTAEYEDLKIVPLPDVKQFLKAEENNVCAISLALLKELNETAS